jgi:hypothetical protein
MTSPFDDIDTTTFLATIAKECRRPGSISKTVLLSRLAPFAVSPFNDTEADAFLLGLVRAGKLRTSSGRFWTPKAK